MPDRSDERFAWVQWFACSLLLGLTLGPAIGCSPPDDKPDTSVTEQDAEDVEDADPDDGGDGTSDADEIDGGGDVDGGGMVATEQCGLEFLDLGTLEVGKSGEKRGNFAEVPAGGLIPGCADEVDEPGAAVLRLQVDEAAKLTARVFGRQESSPKPVVEVHSGACDEEREVGFCRDMTDGEMMVEPGTDYFVWVYGSIETTAPHYRLTWKLEEMGCDPSQPPTCSQGTLSVCDQADEGREAFSCWSECAGDGGGVCAGDSCQSAPVIDVGSGKTTVSGDRFAFTSEWSSVDKMGCVIGSNPDPIETPGVEIFAKLEGVSQGDKLLFDSVGVGGEQDMSLKEESNVAFFILDGCGATSCTAAGLYDADGDNRFEWTATGSGPYWLVAEVLGPRNKTNGFEFDVGLVGNP